METLEGRNLRELNSKATEYTERKGFVSQLTDLLYIKRINLIKQLNISVSTWNTWTSRENITMSDAIKICNTLRIPITYFIDDGMPLPEHISRVAPESFIPIVFDNTGFGNYVCNIRGYKQREMSQVLGCSPVGFRAWYTISGMCGKLTIQVYLDHCKRLGIYPMEFLIDKNNRKLEHLGGYKLVNEEADQQKIQTQARELARQNTEFRDRANRLQQERITILRHNRNLTEANAELKAKCQQMEEENEMLKARNEALLAQLQQYINSMVNDQSYPSMAAEDTAPYNAK